MTKSNRADKALIELEKSVHQLRKQIGNQKVPSNVVTLRPALMDQMTAQAQFMGLKDVEQLTGMVLVAFLDLCEDRRWLKLPLMFQEVDTADEIN
jgi:hypothetical protein